MKIRYLLLLLSIFLASEVLLAQAPYWLRNARGAGNDEVLDIAASGENYYITGYYSDLLTTGLSTLHASQDGDAFVAKIDSNGEYEWSRRILGPYADRGIAISAMSDGRVVVAGTFIGSITLDELSLSSTGASQDIFVACYSPEGSVLWAKKLGGPGIDLITDIQVDQNDEIICTGSFVGQITFGGTTFLSGINPYTNTSSYDIFLCKLDENGNNVWAKQGRTKKNDRSGKIAIAGDNSFFLTGNFSDTLTFTDTYNNNSLNMGFLMRFESNGTEIWFRRIQSSVTEIADMHCNGNSVFLTGRYDGIQRFTSDETINTWQNFSEDNYDYTIYVAGYNYDGILSFCKTEVSDNEIIPKAIIATEDNQNFYVSGEFRCHFSELQNVYGEALYLSRGKKDIYLSAYNAIGERTWSKQIGGTSDDEVNAICVNSFNSPVFGGSFEGSLSSPAKSSWGNKPWYQIFSSPVPNEPTSYCGDSEYDFYAVVKSLGSKDVLVANIADQTRSTMDVFNRSGMSCDHSYLFGSIDSLLRDTSNYCLGFKNTAIPATGPVTINGMNYLYAWNGGNYNAQSLYFPNSSQMVSFTAVAQNTCYSFSDSIYMNVFTQIPNLSFYSNYHNDILNVSGDSTFCSYAVYVSIDDTIRVQATNGPPDLIKNWSHNGVSVGQTNILDVFSPNGGYYEYSITNPENGCSKEICLQVIFVDTTGLTPCIGCPPCTSCTDGIPGVTLAFKKGDQILENGDTFYGCEGDTFSLLLVQTFSQNEWAPFVTATPVQIGLSNPNLGYYPNSPQYSINIHQRTFSIQADTFSGGAININVKVFILLGGIITFAEYNFGYNVSLFPPPEFTYSIDGNFNPVCPGDTAFIQINTNHNFSLSLDSEINQILENEPLRFMTLTPQNYNITFYDTTSQGCIAQKTEYFSMGYYQSPQIILEPPNGIICDSSFVEMSFVNAISVTWLGPSGDTLSNELTYQTDIPGTYFALIENEVSCELISNTVDIRDRSSFGYELTPTFICPGENAVIQMYLLEGDTIRWLPPLDGSNPVQYINNPGIYRFTAPICGVIDTFEVIVPGPDSFAEIQSPDTVYLCGDNPAVVFLQPNPLLDYQWVLTGTYSDSILVNDTGMVILQAMDDNFCVSRDTVTVLEAPVVEPPLAIEELTICSQDHVILYSFDSTAVQWYSGNNFISYSDSLIYEVEYNDAGLSMANLDTLTGCISEKVPVNTNIRYWFDNNLESNSQEYCEGEYFAIAFSPIATNAEVYQWIYFDGTSTSILNDSTLYFFPVDSSDIGTYTLIATGNASDYCKPDTSVIEITQVNHVPDIEIISSIDVVCQSSEIQLWTNSSEDVSGGVWFNGISTFTGDTLILNAENFNGEFLTITYNLDLVNGCTASAFKNIQILPTQLEPLFNDTIFACEGDEITITMPDNQSVFWQLGSNPAQGQASNTFDIVVSPVQEPLFVFNAGLNGACPGTMIEIPFSIKPHVSLPAYSDTILCEGQNLDLSFNPSQYGMQNFYWLDANSNQVIAQNQPFIQLLNDSGTLALYTQSDAAHCGTDSISFSYEHVGFNLSMYVVNPFVSNPQICNQTGGYIQTEIDFFNNDINNYQTNYALFINTGGAEGIINECYNCPGFSNQFVLPEAFNIDPGIAFNLNAYVQIAGTQCADTASLHFENPVPVIPENNFILLSACLGDQLMLNPGNNGTYSWYNTPEFPFNGYGYLGEGIITQGLSALDFEFSGGSQNVYFAQIDPVTGCESEMGTFQINENPGITLPAFNDTTICDNLVLELSFDTNQFVAGNYYWLNLTENEIIAENTSEVTITAQQAQIVLIAVADDNSCGADSSSFSINTANSPFLSISGYPEISLSGNTITLCQSNYQVLVLNEQLPSNEYTYQSSINDPDFITDLPVAVCPGCSENYFLISPEQILQFQEGSLQNLYFNAYDENTACETDLLIQFIVLAPETLNLNLDTIWGCLGDTINIDPPGNNLYNWTELSSPEYAQNLEWTSFYPEGSSPDDYSLNASAYNFIIGNSSQTIYFNLIAAGTNNCQSGYDQIQIDTFPDIVSPILENVSICVDETLEIDFSPVEAGVSEFVWQLANNDLLSDSSLTVLGTSTAAEGEYELRIYADNEHCNADTISFFLSVHQLPVVSILTDSLQLCTGRPFTLDVNSNENIETEWTYGSVSASGSPLTINISNTSDDTLLINGLFTNQFGCESLDSVLININQTPAIPELIIPENICETDTIAITLLPQAIQGDYTGYFSDYNFVLQNDSLIYIPGQNENSINLFTFSYNQNCISDTVVNVFNIGELPVFELQGDSAEFCVNDGFSLEGPSGFSGYLWNTGEQSELIVVNATGVYSLLITDAQGCEFSDSVFVIGNDCEIGDQEISNVFTPNGDGINDYYLLKTSGIKVYSMLILDRWGTAVSTVQNPEFGWDGRNQLGEEMPEATYFFVAEVEFINSEKQQIKGSVQLLR